MTPQKQLTFLTAGYGQVASVFPIVVISPAYFAGAVQLGGLTQTASAFGSVQGALSFFVDIVSAAWPNGARSSSASTASTSRSPPRARWRQRRQSST